MGSPVSDVATFLSQHGNGIYQSGEVRYELMVVVGESEKTLNSIKSMGKDHFSTVESFSGSLCRP